jgi:MFS family permease
VGPIRRIGKVETPSQGADNPNGGVRTEIPEIQSELSTGHVIYATVAAFLAWVFSVYDYILFGTLLPPIRDEFGWSTPFATGLATIIGVGTFLVALAVGPFVDYLGRRTMMLITVAGAALSSGLTALTPSAIYLVVVRTLGGLGYSEQAVNASYLAEIYGRRQRRGFIYGFVQGGWPVGALLAAAMSAWLVPLIGWRGSFLVATFPAIAIVVMRLWLKESPKWEAMQVIRKLEKEGRHEEAVEFGRHYDIDIHHTEETTIRQLFEPDIRWHTIFLSLGFFSQWFGVQVFAVLGTTVLTEGKGTSFGSALTVLIVANAAAYVGYITHGFVGDIIGRRLTTAGGWILCSIAYAIMLLGPSSPGFVLTMYTIGLFFLVGPAASFFFFMGESFPTRVRGTGTAFVNSVGPLGAIVGGALFTAALAAGIGMIWSAFIVGVTGILIGGLCILGTRDVKDPHQAEVLPADESVATS